MAGIIERAETAARTALSDSRPDQAPAALDSKPDLLTQLQGSLRGLGLDVAPAQQDGGQAGSQSAMAVPAAMQNLPSGALNYIMSGILGRWFRQHSPAENKSMLHRLQGQQPSQAEDPGALYLVCLISSGFARDPATILMSVYQSIVYCEASHTRGGARQTILCQYVLQHVEGS